MKLPHKIKSAGNTHEMYVDSLSSICGDIIDGVGVHFDDGRGGFSISLASLREVVNAAEKYQAETRDRRCAVCGWFLGSTIEDGCIRGNCSMRPRPKTLFDAERAAKETP